MRRIRVIPVLTLQNEKLVKTVKFKKPNYIGDPINAVKIFNEKEVDEIIILDITATKEKRTPNYKKIEEIAEEAFMPFAYGGGIQNLTQVEKLFQLGIEKVVINSALANNLELITQIAKKYGTQSVVAAIDVKKDWLGNKNAYTFSGSKKVKIALLDFIKKVEAAGAGEVFLNQIDLDGTYSGYDLDLVSKVANATNLPLIVCGGAASVNDFYAAVKQGASAVAAGSMFVYQGKQKGILINYPSQEVLMSMLYAKL